MFQAQKETVKKIKGLKPLNLKGKGPVDEEHVEPDPNLDSAQSDDDLEVRGLNAMIGNAFLPKDAKKKVLGLSPTKGTSDEKKLNHLRKSK